jgi:hypothetical protein
MVSVPAGRTGRQRAGPRRTQITCSCAAPGLRRRSPQPRRSAALRAFSLCFSITQRYAFTRRSLMPTVDSVQRGWPVPPMLQADGPGRRWHDPSTRRRAPRVLAQMPQVLQLETAQDRLPKSDTAAPRIGQYGLGYVQPIAGHDSDLRFCG